LANEDIKKKGRGKLENCFDNVQALKNKNHLTY
jgi:hypothetical protein